MSTESLWLTLDQGGHASRAIVFDAHGNVVTQAFVAISTHTEGELVTHVADEITQSLQDCIDQVAQSLGKRVAQVQAAGLATQRSSIVCWRRDTGAALSPVLSWQDRRGAEWLKQFAAQRARVQQLTGLMLSPHYGASKLHWCLQYLPAVQQAAHAQQLSLGPLSSYLLRQLLVERPYVVDPANASRTQLWSPATGDWCDELLSLFDVPRALLPQCVPSRRAFGTLLVGDHSVPLTVCTGDQAAVPFASGALVPHCVYLNLGTGAFALAPLSHDITDAAPLLRSVLWSDAVQTIYALEGTVNGAAAALQWLADRTSIEVARMNNALDGQHLDPTQIPLFINSVGGLGSPYWQAQLPPQFVPTQALDTQPPAALAAAVLESIAFLLADNLELMRRHLPDLRQIHAGGGLSANAYLCQCLADLSGMAIWPMQERELTAKGLAYLLAHSPSAASGAWSTSHGNGIQPTANTALHERRQQWRRQLAALLP